MAIYDKTIKELCSNIAKRAMLLIAKLLGFKAFCLFLTTVLLKNNIVGKEEWLTVIVTIICSVSGIHIADSIKTNSGARNGIVKKNNPYSNRNGNKPYLRPAGNSANAKDEARKRIEELCRQAAAQLE